MRIAPVRGRLYIVRHRKQGIVSDGVPNDDYCNTCAGGLPGGRDCDDPPSAAVA